MHLFSAFCKSRNLFGQIFNRLHNIIAELTAGTAGVAAGYTELFLFKHTNVESAGKKIGLVLLADVGKQHYCGSEHRAGIGIFIAAFLHHTGCGAVDGLKHGVALAQVGAMFEAIHGSEP